MSWGGELVDGEQQHEQDNETRVRGTNGRDCVARVNVRASARGSISQPLHMRALWRSVQPAGLMDKIAQSCNAKGIGSVYFSRDLHGVFTILGYAGEQSRQAVLPAARTFAIVDKLDVKDLHFAPKLINGVKFLEGSSIGSNDIFKGSAWNLVVVTEKNGLIFYLEGAVEYSGNSQIAGEKMDIISALNSIRFTKPSKVAKPAKPARPAPAPQAPTDVCDPGSNVCASANNLHQDSGGEVPPPSGQQFVVVHVKLVNNGSQSADYNPFDFILKGADTHVDYQPDAIDINVSNSLEAGTLLSGDIVEGDLVFQAPSGENSFSLIWQPDITQDPMGVPIS